jgi:hypothetical protein
MTPFVESPTGRLTELVYLLSDRPLSLVHQAVLDAEAEADRDKVKGGSDPWAIVASALRRLETMTEESLVARAKRGQQARTAAGDRELVVT